MSSQMPDLSAYLLANLPLDLYVTLIAMISVAGFILKAQAFYVAVRDYRLKRSKLTVVQMCTIFVGLLETFASACGYHASSPVHIRDVPAWVIFVGKWGKPMWVLELTMFLLLSQYRFSIVIPNRTRDICMFVFTAVFGVTYFILAALEMAQVLRLRFDSLTGAYQLGYIVFLTYTVTVDNIISWQILRKLFRAKTTLLTKNSASRIHGSTSYVLSSKTYHSQAGGRMYSATGRTFSTTSQNGGVAPRAFAFSTIPPMDELAVKYGVHIEEPDPRLSSPFAGYRSVPPPISPYHHHHHNILGPPLPQNDNPYHRPITPSIPPTPTTPTISGTTLTPLTFLPPPTIPDGPDFSNLPRPSRRAQLSNLQRTIRSLIGNIIIIWIFMAFDIAGSVLIVKKYVDWGQVCLCVGTTMGLAGLWFYYVRFTHVLRRIVAEGNGDGDA
ncbi:hypothetical protein HDV00_000049 [Rhizophlyctis rosea]|nr:hypothetical protein HDV00_000049 [Rhizophlyctis rosea]